LGNERDEWIDIAEAAVSVRSVPVDVAVEDVAV
jgi:hypothetical protein